MSCGLDYQSCTLDGGGYSGISTDADGLLQSGDYVDLQVGGCGGALTEDFLQMPTSVVYSPDDVQNIQDLYGVDAGTDTVILNAEASEPGNVCIDISQQAQTHSVIEQLADQGTCMFASDEDTRCATLDALQRAYRSKYGEDAPRTWSESISHYVEEFGSEALLLMGIALVFGKVVPWLSGPRGPRGPGGPSTPGGGGEPRTVPETPVTEPRPTPRVITDPSRPWYSPLGDAWNATGEWVADNQVGIRNGLIAATVTLVVVDAVIVADDVTGVGVADDVALIGTVPATVLVGAAALLFGANMSDFEAGVSDTIDEI